MLRGRLMDRSWRLAARMAMSVLFRLQSLDLNISSLVKLVLLKFDEISGLRTSSVPDISVV